MTKKISIDIRNLIIKFRNKGKSLRKIRELINKSCDYTIHCEQT